MFENGASYYKLDEDHNHILLYVNVKPNSKEQLIEVENDRIIIHLKSPPTKGKANKELISLIAKALKLRKSDISVIKGQKSKIKTLSISNTSVENISKLLNYKF